MKEKTLLSWVCIIWIFANSSCSLIDPPPEANNTKLNTANSFNANSNRRFPPVNINNPKEKAKFDKEIEEINKHRNLWKSQNIFNYDYFCEVFTGGTTVYNPVMIQVRGSQTFSVEESVISGFHYHFNFKELDSIEKMFDYIEKELERGSHLNLKFNKKYGYLEDWTVKFGMNIHDYYVFKISKFEIIK